MIQKNWESLIKSNQIDVRYLDSSLRDAEIIVEPLERGFGITLGNSIRRILLSSLQGAAICAIKVDSALHEFSTIPGVLEDITEIVLNLKKISVRLYSELTKKVKLSIRGPAVVCGKDIQSTSDVEILDPDAFICTLDKGAHLNMELTIKSGKGYLPANHHMEEGLSLGTIPIDALFSPVKRVDFHVQQTRVGQRTDYDSLRMRISTNGNLKPEEAVACAAKILQDQLNQFIIFGDVFLPGQDHSENRGRDFLNPNLLRKVDDLELSVRSANCLKNENIFYIGDLVQKSENDMLRTPNFGRKSLNEIKEMLHHMGLTFGMMIPSWPPSDLEELSKTVDNQYT